MKQAILDHITKAHQAKQETKRVPHYITFREINEALGGVDRTVLRELVEEGKIEWGRTINDVWFSPKFDLKEGYPIAKNQSETTKIST